MNSETNPSWFDSLDLASMLASDAVPQPMLVPELIPAEEVGVIAGEPVSSKTEFCLTMAISLTTGMPFLGLDLPRRCPVVYVAMEGSRWSIQERVRRMVRALPTSQGLDLQHRVAADLHIICPSGHPGSSLAEPMARVSEYVEAMVKNGIRPGLVVIDTMACVIVGDENSAESARNPWAYAKYISTFSGATVLFIHHLGKPVYKQGQAPRSIADAMRGTSAHRGSARFILGLSVKKCKEKADCPTWMPGSTGDQIELKVLERNDGPSGYRMVLERDRATGALSVYEPSPSEDEGRISRPRTPPTTKAMKVLRIYQDQTLGEKARKGLALSLFSDSDDPQGALRGAFRRLRQQGHEL